MKLSGKITAAALAVLLAASAAGCADKSWAAKSDSLTVPIGAYIYNLYAAYAQAQSKAPDQSKAVLGQKIENKDASAWIRAKALTYTKEFFVIDKKMKDLKLSLTADEKKQAGQMTDQAWSSYSSAFQKYGIAKSSFQMAYADNAYKESKVFDAVYGKGGAKAVPDADLKSYYAKTYTNFSYLRYPLYTTNADGSMKAAFSAADKKKAEGVLDGYAAQMKAGKMTPQQAGDALKKVLKSSSDQLNSTVADLATDTSMPQTLVKALKAMKTGEIKTVEVKDDNAYYLLVKNDIQKDADEKLKDDSGRKQILSAYKWQEFSDGLAKEADALSGVTLNDAAISSYDPSMFADTSSSTS